MDTELLIEKFRKPVLIFAGLVLVYALAGFVLLPKFMQSKLPEFIESETGRKASIEHIEFNPFSLELSLQGFVMQEQDLQTFVSFNELFTNLQVWSSLWNLALVLDELRLSGPYVRLEMLKDDRYNFSDLLSEEEQEEETEESSDIFPVIIHKIKLELGEFATINSVSTEPVKKVISNINFNLDNFSTLPDTDADLGFSLALNGNGRLVWHGGFGVNPLFSKGEVTIEGLQFADVWKLFLQDSVQYKWLEGSQSIAFSYELSYPEETLIFNLTKGRLVTKDLKFTSKEETKEFLKIPYLLVDGISFDLIKQTLDIEKIESTDAGFDFWYEPSGQLNYQTFFAGQETEIETEETNIEKQESEQTQEPQPWNINILDMAVKTASVNYSDTRKEQAVILDIAALDIGLKNYQLTLDKLLQITANQGHLNLRELALSSNDSVELIKVPTLDVSEVDFNLQDRNVNIKTITSSDAQIKSWLAKNGELNYQKLFPPSAPESDTSETGAKKSQSQEAPWLLNLQAFNIDNYAVQFTDNTTDKPAVLNLTGMKFSVTDVDNKPGTPLPLSFSARFNKHGKIKISGNSVLEPFKTDLDIKVSQVGINNFEPYINQSAHLDIIGGNFNTQGKLVISQAEQADLKLKYRGNITIKALHTRDHILNQDFLNWQQLSLNGLDFNLHPGELKIKAITLDKPYARVTIKKDKTTNISDVMVAEKPDQKAKASKNAPAPFVYKIDKFTMTSGLSDFSDYSLILPFVVKLNDLDGVIGNISSNSKAITKIKLDGKAFDLSPVNIQGSLNADLDELDITMHYKSFPLPFLSPYMVEFSGDKIEKGKMSLDLRYQVRDKKLSATNDLVIDQFELGEKVDNPDAVQLPLRLAAVLLRDKDGRININMPVHGSMDDPEFSVGRLILDVFINLLTKVAASPFTAIGSFLDSDADFSVVAFTTGSADIDAEQGKKLAELATALAKKTELSLEVKGVTYTNQDWPSMKENALNDQLKQIYSDELKKSGKTQLAEYIELSEKDYQRLLADLFIKTFPDLAERSFFGTPQLIYPDMGDFYTVASNMLQSMIEPDKNKLNRLAMTRARNIARYMVEQGKIEQSRIFILDGQVVEEAENNAINALLTLKVQ